MDGLLKRQSTSDQIAAALTELICAGRLKPGERLREVQLAELLGVSRGSIREAIPLLTAEGLVRHEIHKGASVASLTEADVRDLYGARRVIERAGVQSARRRPADELAAAGELVEELQRVVDRGDWLRIASADLAFHSLLVGFVGSPRLDRFFASVCTELRLLVAMVEQAFYPEPRGLVAEHEAIYEALVERDFRRCARLVAEHLDQAEALAVRALARTSVGER